MVLLDPPVTEEPLLDAPAAPVAAAGGAGRSGANPPAKIDPSLPGVAHPAARGTPGLDTIAETFTTGGSASNQGQAPGPQGQSSGGSAQNQVAVVPPQGQTSGPAASTTGHSEISSSALRDPDGAGEGKVELARRHSVATPSMTATSNIDSEETGKETSVGLDGGSSEHGVDRKFFDASATSGAAGNRADGSDAVGAEPEEGQYGAHKKIISANPPFESDEDEDEQEHDISHPEGFLRAMPEDESGMRVLTLPEGRVRRVEDDDEEYPESTSSDQGDASVASQAAPSSAQAPPLSSALASPPAGVAPAPPTQAPKPGAVAGAVDGPPPVMEGATLLSRENSGSLSSAVEGNSIVTMAGSSTPGTVSPSGMLPPNMSISQGTTFTVIGGIEQPVLAQAAPAGDKSSAGPVPPYTGCDPGLLSPPVGMPVDLQRARSFSPIDRTVEVLNVAALPPIAPAPPCPVAPSDFVQPQANFRVPQEVMAAGDGSAQAMGVEGERTPFSSNQGDQELQGLLSGTMGLGGKQTEIMIANLQGPEQEIMRLVMHTHVEGRLQEVDFDFNLDYDHPEQVRVRRRYDVSGMWWSLWRPGQPE